MTLLELLVKELPKRGGWPDNAVQSWQSLVDGEIYFDSSCGKRVEYRNGDIYLPIVGNGLHEVITREQYEAAIAAQQPIAEFHSRTFPNFKAITVVERDDSWVGTKVDGEAYHCYKRHWDIEFISNQPVWNGDGLPPIGIKCEWQDHKTKKWITVRVVYSSEWITIISEDKDDDAVELAIENYGDKGRRKFRPLRTEEDRKRDIAVGAMEKSWEGATDKPAHAFESIYDAIAAGKIPGVELSK